MEIRFKRCLVLAVLAVVAGATAVSAGSVQWESYAVKFQCGNIESGSEVTAVDGRYFTTVNIHNPHYLMDATGAPIPVQFFKKIVLALPQFTDPLPPSCYLEEFLEADFAVSVTCRNIKTQLALSGLPSTGLIEGFVVVLVPSFQGVGESRPPDLDVTAFYTGRTRAKAADLRDNGNGVAAWDVETYDPVEIRGQPTISICDEV